MSFGPRKQCNNLFVWPVSRAACVVLACCGVWLVGCASREMHARGVSPSKELQVWFDQADDPNHNGMVVLYPLDDPYWPNAAKLLILSGRKCDPSAPLADLAETIQYVSEGNPDDTIILWMDFNQNGRTDVLVCYGVGAGGLRVVQGYLRLSSGYAQCLDDDGEVAYCGDVDANGRMEVYLGSVDRVYIDDVYTPTSYRVLEHPAEGEGIGFTEVRQIAHKDLPLARITPLF